MDAGPARPSPAHDPDLDPPRGAPPPPPGPLRHAPEDYRRLVVNPFLTLLGLVVWLAVLRRTLRERWLGMFLAAFFGVFAVALLLQYHCLDCGRTGSFWRWRRHACERVREREREDRPRAVRGPRPGVQLLFWILGLTIVALLAVLAARG